MPSLFRHCVGVLVISLIASHSAIAKPDKHKTRANDASQLRAAYLAKLQERNLSSADEHTLGSLWSPRNNLGDMATDYKAHRLNDTVTIDVAVATAAAQSGSVDTSRAFTTNSSITGIMGQTPAAANPLLAAQSATALKGSGQTASNSSFQTSLTGQVIAVLASGNLVIEAEREVFMNNQHEHIIVAWHDSSGRHWT